MKLLLTLLAMAGTALADVTLKDETIGDMHVQVVALDNGKFRYTYQVDDWFDPADFEDPGDEWWFPRFGYFSLSREGEKVKRGFGQLSGGKLMPVLFRSPADGPIWPHSRRGRIPGVAFRVPLNGRVELSFVSRGRPVVGVVSYGFDMRSPWGHQGSWSVYPFCWVPGTRGGDE